MLRGGATKKGIYKRLRPGRHRPRPHHREAIKANMRRAPSSSIRRSGSSISLKETALPLRYGIGVGRAGFQWKGTHKITSKKKIRIGRRRRR